MPTREQVVSRPEFVTRRAEMSTVYLELQEAVKRLDGRGPGARTYPGSEEVQRYQEKRGEYARLASQYERDVVAAMVEDDDEDTQPFDSRKVWAQSIE